jgi:hypothetical protein
MDGGKRAYEITPGMRHHVFSTRYVQTFGSLSWNDVYFRKPELFDLLQVAVKLRIITARSVSERIEEMIAVEIRRLRHHFRAAGTEVLPSLLEKKDPKRVTW